MPFPMVHFDVAHALRARFTHDDMPLFYLGNLAPDAFHSRDVAHYEDRAASHLMCPDAEWWRDNTARFLKERAQGALKPFYAGYGVHILTDILWENTIYRDFMRAFESGGDATPQEQRRAYAADMVYIDVRLYRRCSYRDELWTCLAGACSVDAEGLVTAGEIDAERARTLAWYDERAGRTLTPPRYIAPEAVDAFICDAAGAIADTLALVL